MTTVSSKTVLFKALGFALEDGLVATWCKYYPNHGNYKISIDVEAENIDYGNKIETLDRSTCNFKAAENFVVLECVNRLLEKGYKPENLLIEKRWSTGHGTSGKLDILVTHDNGSAYLMIECKTPGAEFIKEFKRVQRDGGQLFTYFQQDKCADVLMLYASSCNSKGQISYQNEIIKIEEDYRQTSNVIDFYGRWNKLTKNNGVFEDWVQPYDFESKALIPSMLEEITQKDSSFIFNQFLEILRHNVVSDKPNAFNKIFTLFLCKIYDEKSTRIDDELAFQWFYTNYTYEGISYPPDNHVSFQKRLTDLYKKGMKEFLDKEVTDISDVEFQSKYSNLSKKVQEQLLNELVEIRLKKNNEFAFKEVYDDESFEDNAKVVKEVVELLQNYKIRYTKKQQYLSDFFEMLLTTGLKQESGQFFTPIPIAQFIIKSLPLDKMIKEKLEKGEKGNYLPTMIDYAAGSGHFITEGMHEVQSVINSLNPDDYILDISKNIQAWKVNHFDWASEYVYGIEKDYRLVKVGKVGCYLHGDGIAQIIHSDGLADFDGNSDYTGILKRTSKDNPQENRQFDIVISNPPYSVAAFKNNASKYYGEKDFELYNSLTDQSSEIESLFIERTKQLLRDGGLAGIILPSSILSNSGIYTKAREIILKYFELVGIAEFGSNTFMATGTNTVTLFLRRRDNYTYKNILSSLERVFETKRDFTINQVQKPLSNYVEYVWNNLNIDDYLTLLAKSPNEAVKNHENYKNYKKNIKSKDSDALLGEIIAREYEKISYFILTFDQKVVIVKTGDKKEEKIFLGYEFSNRRGNEGIHPIQKGKKIDECTQLFDPVKFDNPEKASTYIYKAFNGEFDLVIPDSLQKNVSYQNLVDMLTFDRSDFEKSIQLSIKKKVNYESFWNSTSLKSLSEISNIQKGTSITKSQTVEGNIPVIAGGQEPAYFHNTSNRNGNIITISASGAYSGFVNYFGNPIFASDCNTIQSKDERKISTKLIFEYLKLLQKIIYTFQRGQAQPHVYSKDLAKIKIPCLPKQTQDKIIKKIEEIDKLEELKTIEIKEIKSLIQETIKSMPGSSFKIGQILSLEYGKSLPEYERVSGNYPVFGSNGVVGFHNKYLITGPSVIVGRKGSAGKVVWAEDNSFPIDTTFYVRLLDESNSLKLIYYILKELNLTGAGTGVPGLNRNDVYQKSIVLPSLDKQKEITSQIEKLEGKLINLEKEIADISKQKEIILKNI